MRRIAVIGAFVTAVVAVAPALASQLIDRNASGVRLAVDERGHALLTYRARGAVRHVLAWGAVNARQPSSGQRQVRFRKDYSGGWGSHHRSWTAFANRCRRYDGPALAFLVAACKAPDGSYWALQSWRTPLPDLGMAPWLPLQRARELHLSHWAGPIAKLEAWPDWVGSRRYHQVFGRLSYDGKPVYGFGTTRVGAPTDGYGRLIYLDTYNSRYGKGWRRENSFVAHNPTGVFCYAFYALDPTHGYPHPSGYPSTPRGPGNGEKYRLTASGPGVTPDVSVVVQGLQDFNRDNPADVEFERQQNAVLDSIVSTDKLCRTH